MTNSNENNQISGKSNQSGLKIALTISIVLILVLVAFLIFYFKGIISINNNVSDEENKEPKKAVVSEQKINNEKDAPKKTETLKDNTLSEAEEYVQQGYNYLTGSEGVDKDVKRALSYFEKADELGNMDGTFFAGWIYGYEYFCITQDSAQALDEATKYFEKCSKSDPFSELCIDNMEYHGMDHPFTINEDPIFKMADSKLIEYPYIYEYLYTFIPSVKDDEISFLEHMEKAVELGNPCAMDSLGLCYEFGTHVDKNEEKAYELYEKAADILKNGKRMHGLALHYMSQGNDDKALEMLKKGVEYNSSDAMWTLGVYYENGKGVEQNYKEAFKLYEDSAYLKNDVGMLRLGHMYKNGTGVAQDYGKAMEWYKKAADAGNDSGMNMIGVLYRDSLGVEQDYGKAMEWFKKAADAGNENGMANIGALYYKGEGVEQDYYKAFEWTEKAANAGSNIAMFNVGWQYYYGQGVEQNNNKALEWFKKAVASGYDGDDIPADIRSLM